MKEAISGRRAVGWRTDRAFYTGMSVAALAAVLLGFGRTYYLRPHYQATPLPIYLHLHGIVFTAWLVLLVTQTALVAARRTDIHRRLGWAGAALAGMMVVAAMTAATISGRRDVAAGNAAAARAFLTVPIADILVFLALVGAAVFYRRRPETHKRLMLLATITILDAAVARWPLALVSATPWAYYALTDVFIVAAIAYDVLTSRRVAAPYIWGGLLIVAAQILRDVVGTTHGWTAFATWWLG